MTGRRPIFVGGSLWRIWPALIVLAVLLGCSGDDGPDVEEVDSGPVVGCGDVKLD